jgi:hypothetical protein
VCASFAHCGTGLNAIATECGNPEETSGGGIESAHEPTISNERTQARPRAHRMLNSHGRSPLDAIDRNRDVEFFRLNIVRSNGIRIGG